MPTEKAPTAAPMVSAERASLPFTDGSGLGRELDCLYVTVDARSRRDVADFLAECRACCDEVRLDWQSVRRPPSVLVGLELRRCCAEPGDTPSIRIVFEATKDAAALEALAETDVLVVGSRGYGNFANSMVAFGVDGGAVLAAASMARTAARSRR